ncbi:MULTISPECIES: DoxX family protein [unclassified Streptomyces]|uniref:DoxX family protein n=1 Tax=unclassified Streptomyces TaxID=2593676 RepID=UPI00383034DB
MAANARSARLLARLLAGAGTVHFLAPKPFDAMIPRTLPGSPRAWTYASGAAELAIAAAIAVPRTRRAGAVAAAGLFAVVFPANVKMAHDWRNRPAPLKAAAYARLPGQVPLILWALHTAREAARPGAASD